MARLRAHIGGNGGFKRESPGLVIRYLDFGAKVPARFETLVSRLAAQQPRLVIVDGDSTSGNADDTATADDVETWWKAFHASLACPAPFRRGPHQP